MFKYQLCGGMSPVDAVSVRIEAVPGQGRDEVTLGGDVCVEPPQVVLLTMREGPGKIDLRQEDLGLGESGFSHFNSTLQLSNHSLISPVCPVVEAKGQDDLLHPRGDGGLGQDGHGVPKGGAWVAVDLKIRVLEGREPGRVGVTQYEPLPPGLQAPLLGLVGGVDVPGGPPRRRGRCGGGRRGEAEPALGSSPGHGRLLDRRRVGLPCRGVDLRGLVRRHHRSRRSGA